MEAKTPEKYRVNVDNVPAKITILSSLKEFVPIYHLSFPRVEPATKAVLDSIRERMVTELDIKPMEIINPEEMGKLKKEFHDKSMEYINEELPHLDKEDQEVLAGLLMHRSLGLGPLEIMLQDKNLEEIVINSSKEPIWVYHRLRGWLKTNVRIPSELEIYNYAAMIGRRVGTQITNLDPLMDAYLTTGDRANATLFPISSTGNTITIRKFARKPWTITDFIKEKAISSEAAAFLWMALQYELNIIVAGGTASGKTSLLNVLSYFIPPNHRIISIEDTREIQLPNFLHWVPLTTRPPNPEGRGEVTMLQLMINALRMRPDRMIVGEIRRSREAEVLFEAMHTGHSVYSTLHANTAEEAYNRLTNPPINIPESMMGTVQLIAVMHRDRRKEIRRVFQVAEIIASEGEGMKMELNDVFRWLPLEDKIISTGKSIRVLDDITLYTGMDEKAMQRDIDEKKTILEWLVKRDINDVDSVCRIISQYYTDPQSTLKRIKGGKS